MPNIRGSRKTVTDQTPWVRAVLSADRPLHIAAVLFDFDGTLTRPGAIDFLAIKKQIGCPPQQPILEYIATLPFGPDRQKAEAILEQMEMAAAAESTPQQGAENLLHALRDQNIKLGILTRNARNAVLRALENFKTIDAAFFDAFITRDDPVPPKPKGDGVVLAAQQLRTDPHHMIMVGDFVFDILAGRDAGAWTAWLDNGGAKTATPPEYADTRADFTLTRIGDLAAVVRLGRPLANGKLPNDLLQTYLDSFVAPAPEILVRPGVGEDAAVVQTPPQDHLILKSDPITFATDAIADYTILVNANDIAACGGRPRWMLTTLLMPPASTPAVILRLMHDLQQRCAQEAITLCGGHTEITDAVTRPVITGMLVGTANTSNLIRKQNMAPGDTILVTKGIAVEGTAIMAREFPQRLQRLGLSPAEIKAAQALLADLSIRPEARLASASPHVTAMHDVTEGGLATALTELSIAGNHHLEIDLAQIPILPLCRKICALLAIDPLGLIGSGSLLIACRSAHSHTLIDSITKSGITVTSIGTVGTPGTGIHARQNGHLAPWPQFDTDEITRLF